MPKQPIQSSGRSKFRLLFIDGDLSTGDLQQLTHAIAGALRPAPTVAKISAATRIPPDGEPVDDTPDNSDLELNNPSELSNEESSKETQATRPPAQPRKYRSPKVVNDLDMKSVEKPFEEFVLEKGNPSEHTTRFLVAAYWLAEFAKRATVSVDYVYTCYKYANWTFDLIDPAQPFRKLKAAGLGDTKSGNFTINHVGISRVEKIKPVAS